LVLDLPGLERKIRRRGGIVGAARRKAPESRELLVLHLGNRSPGAPRREGASADEVVDRGYAQAGLRAAARPVPWMHARLLVLAPAPVQQHQHAVGERGGDVLAQSE